MNFGKTLDDMLTHEERELLDEIMVDVRRKAEERRHVEYYKKSICIDTEDYRDLVNEESNLYRELCIAREKLERNANDEHLMDLIVNICHEISENVDAQIRILVNIRKNQAKL